MWRSCAFRRETASSQPDRTRLSLHIVCGDRVVVRDLATGAVRQVPIPALRPVPQPTPEPRVSMDLSLVSDDDWAVARMRYQALKPLVEAPRTDSRVLKEAAASAGRHPATLPHAESRESDAVASGRRLELPRRRTSGPAREHGEKQNRAYRARTLAEGRSGKRAAREQFEPVKGHFPSEGGPSPSFRSITRSWT